jgi:hypothetical protein
VIFGDAESSVATGELTLRVMTRTLYLPSAASAIGCKNDVGGLQNDVITFDYRNSLSTSSTDRENSFSHSSWK